MNSPMSKNHCFLDTQSINTTLKLICNSRHSVTGQKRQTIIELHTISPYTISPFMNSLLEGRKRNRRFN